MGRLVTHGRMGRRQVIRGTGAAAFALTVMRPELVRGTDANSKIRLALFGCGGRGQWISKLFTRHGGYRVVACHDYFKDRTVDMNNTMAIIKAPLIDEAMRFTGINGYKRLLDKAPGQVDAVAVINPPFFRAEQAAAVIDAGLHAYLAKPLAVDVPQALAIAAAGKKATATKRVCLVDFQLRSDPSTKESVAKVRGGAIGRIISGECQFTNGIPWRGAEALRKRPDDADARMRGWGLDRRLSGDILVEQNIHNVDLATWVLDAAPVAAVGYGGCGCRDVGDCFDHFNITYRFPNDVHLTFMCTQFGKGYADLFCRFYGTEGTYYGSYFKAREIIGREKYRKAGNMFESGTVANIADFHARIAKGQVDNPTVEPSVRSNLACILGREAGYAQGTEVTWDAVMKKAERWETGLKGLTE
jgi:predicted dehydrogenase